MIENKENLQEMELLGVNSSDLETKIGDDLTK